MSTKSLSIRKIASRKPPSNGRPRFYSAMCLSKLKPYKKNPRQNEEAVAAVVKSLEQFGKIAPIIVNEKLRICAGHTRFKAALERGERTFPTLVVPGLTGERFKAYNIADNQTASIAQWDTPALAAIIKELQDEGFPTEALGFAEDQLEEIMASLEDDTGGLTDPDDVPEPPKKAITKTGDLWLLGDHKILCGDATKAEDVDRVCMSADCCFTSPPYNAGVYTLTGNVAKTDKSSRYHGVDDDKPEDEYVELLTAFTALAMARCRLIAVNIQQLAGNKCAVLRWGSAFAEHFVDRAVWYKGHGNPAMAPSVMASRFEDIWLFAPKRRPTRAIPTAKFRGTVENVIEFVGASAENKSAAIHAAVMPISVCTWAIQSWTALGMVIYEPFCGSGTTIIAAENLNRKCMGIEIEPIYVDVAVLRWQKYTGKKAVLIRNGKKSKITMPDEVSKPTGQPTKYKDLSPAQKQRNIARCYGNVLKKRGKVSAKYCRECGSQDKVQLHHPDIVKKPHEVIPLCRQCHLKEHRKKAMRSKHNETKATA